MSFRASLVALLLLSMLPAQGNRITWQTDLTQAKALAADKRAPLFVVFRCEA